MSWWIVGVTLAFVGAFLLGVRATWRLWKRWRHDPERLLLFALFAAALVITVTAGWVGFLSVRRLLGFEPISWSPVVTTVLAIVLVFLPEFLERVVDRIERGP